jgi:hypothetical protein
MRRIIHQFGKFTAFIDGRDPLAPGQYRGKKTHDLPIL